MNNNSLLSPQLALLISGVANSFFFGVLTVQVYIHYMAFPRESLQLRFMVVALYLLQVSATAIVCYRNYILLAPTRMSWVDGVVCKLAGFELVILAVTMSTVQLYYAKSIRQISRRLIFPWLIVCCSILQLQAASTLAVLAFVMPDPTLSARIMLYQIQVWHFANAACDVTIATCMTYYLMRYFCQTRWAQKVVKRVVRLTIETGVVITLVTLGCSSLFFLAHDHGNFSIIYTSIIGALYCNSLLALLNGRPTNRVKVEAPVSAIAFACPMVAQNEVELSTTSNTLGKTTASLGDSEEASEKQIKSENDKHEGWETD